MAEKFGPFLPNILFSRPAVMFGSPDMTAKGETSGKFKVS